MGGTLAVTSAPGAGTRVVASLPLPAAPLPEPEALQVGTTRPTEARRVLLVDDDPDLREVMRLMLETLGATVTEAGGGDEALRLAADGPCDVVILDVHMPDTDGYAVARALRERHGRELRVIGLTGAATAEARLLGLAAGMDDYVAKPVSLERLRRVLAGVPRRT
jgi:two-component system sensor histidine kinase EvgS